MGWDKHYGFQLYQSDPSGNFGGWKATCIGNNSAVSILFSLHSGVEICPYYYNNDYIFQKKFC